MNLVGRNSRRKWGAEWSVWCSESAQPIVAQPPATTVSVSRNTGRDQRRARRAVDVDAVEFGAAQRRRRLLAGPPAVLERFRTAPRTASKTIRQAFQAAGVALPEGATCVLNTNGDACSLDGPAFTVCATRALTWGRAAAAGTDADAPPHRKRAGTVRCMTPAESARLPRSSPRSSRPL